MGSREKYIKDIDFLARSYSRVHLLSLLKAHQQLDKDEIKKQCSVDRTTLQRNLDALEERGWIENSIAREYQITLCGEMVAETFLDLIDTIETTDKLDGLLRWVPTGSLDLDPLLLADAQVTVADQYDPYAAVNRHVEALKTTEEFKGLFQVIGRDGLEVRRQMLLDGHGLDELVVSSGAAEVLQSGSSYAPLVSEILESGNLSIFVYDGTIPYYLGLYDEMVQIGVEDDEGMPRAVVETDSGAVREWAKQEYERYREKSRRL